MSSTTRDRDRTIDEAIKAGKFPEDARRDYEAMWDARPAATAAAIDALYAYKPDPVFQEARVHDRVMAAMGVKSQRPGAAQTAPAQPRAVSSATRVAASRAQAVSASVSRDPASGELTFLGHRVVNASGEPHVFTESGWMKVSKFQTAGLTADDLTGALAIMAGSPSGPLAQTYRAGPS